MRWDVECTDEIGGDKTGDELAVNDADFTGFVRRHESMGARMSVEDNSDMLGSYVMIDPQGRFFQNRTGQTGRYFYSPPITADNIHEAFASISFSVQRFAARYRPAPQALAFAL